MITHTLNATNKSIGRVASEAAAILLGKKTSDVRKNAVADVAVTIENASRASISVAKRLAKTQTHYTGHPGGLKRLSPEQIIQKKGYGELFRKAVFGMLPSNKLRARRMKRLFVKE